MGLPAVLFYMIISLIYGAINAQIRIQTEGKYSNLTDYLLGQIDEHIRRLETSPNPFDWIQAQLVKFIRGIVSALLGMVDFFIITEQDVTNIVDLFTGKVFDRLQEGQTDIKIILSDLQSILEDEIVATRNNVINALNDLYASLTDTTKDIIHASNEKLKEAISDKFNELEAALGEGVEAAGGLSGYIKAALEGVESGLSKELDEVAEYLEDQTADLVAGAQAIATSEVLSAKLLSKDLTKKIDELAFPTEETLDQSVDVVLDYQEKIFKKHGGLLGNWISTAGTPNALIQSVNILFNRLFRITPLPLEVAIYLYQSGRITEEQYKSILADWGYDELAADILYTVLQRRPTINELVRGLFYLYAKPHNINNVWQSIETYLRDYGYTEEQARVITASMKYLPSLSDVLSWMAKEAFEEDMVRILGLDDEFPEKFAEYAAKIGIPYEDALRYWRAHWSTPGWSQVAEAFHRARGNAYIDNTYEHTMSEWDRIWDVYYRQAEVPRFWRQLLTSITYNVITRVDARRMYEMGFIDKKELAAIYMKLGYTKEDAELMADWVAWEVQED